MGGLTSDKAVLRHLLHVGAVDADSAIMRQTLLDQVGLPENTARGAIVRLCKDGSISSSKTGSGIHYYITPARNDRMTPNQQSASPDYNLELDEEIYSKIEAQALALNRDPEAHLEAIIKVGIKVYARKLNEQQGEAAT